MLFKIFKQGNMDDELSRWIQEAVFSSYMEECQIFNELDGAYGLNYNLVQESSSGAARKRKCSWDEDNSVSAGKQSRSG